MTVGPSVCHTTFFAFLGILRVGKFVFEHAPAQIITAPAQIITAPAQIIIAPAQIITAPAQQPATGAVVYTALFACVCLSLSLFGNNTSEHVYSHQTLISRFLLGYILPTNPSLFNSFPHTRKTTTIPHGIKLQQQQKYPTE